MTREQLMALLMFLGASISAVAAGVALYYSSQEIARLRAQLKAK